MDRKYYKTDLKKEKKLVSNILFLFTIAFIGYSMQDFRGTQSTILSLILFFSCMILAFLYNPFIYFKLFRMKKYHFLLIFIGFYFAGGIASGLGLIGIMKIIFGFVLVLSPMIIFDIYVLNNARKHIRLLVIFTLSMYLILSIKTLIVLKKVPNAARALASGKMHNEQLGKLADLGIGGGFDLTYALCLLVPLLIILLKKNKFRNKITATFIFLELCISVLTIIKADYGMAFIFTMFGIIISLFILTGNFKKDLLISSSVFFFCLLFYSVFKIEIANLLFFISTFFNSSYIGQRLGQLAFGILGQGYGQSISDRFILYGKSFNTFLENIFVGTGYKSQYDYYKSLSYIGGHSEWLDSLGLYGLLGSLPYFLFLILQFKGTMNNYSKSNLKSTVFIIYMMFFIIGGINLIMKYVVLVALFFVLPGILYMVESSIKPVKGSSYE